MKTKFNARALAWLLSICMIVGIIPAMPVELAQAADSDVLTYDFSGVVAKNTFLVPAEASKYGNAGLATTYGYDCPKAAGSAEWAMHSIAKSFVDLNNAYVNFLKEGFRQFSSSSSYYITINLKIKVPDAGRYVPYIKNKQWNADKSTLKVTLYELNQDGSFGTVVFTNTDVAAGTVDLGTKLSEAVALSGNTEYGLQFHMTGGTKADGEENPLVDTYSFSLKEVSDTITPSEEIPFVIELNKNITRSFKVMLGDTDRNAKFSVTSSDNEVVSVSENAGAFTLVGAGTGTAKITVTGTYGDPVTEISEEYYVAVRPASSADGSLIYYFNGIIDRTVSLMTDAQWINADRLLTVNNYATYEKTAANLSSPWKIRNTYRSSVDADKNVFFTPENVQIKNTGANGTVAYIDIKYDSAGWYTVKTDAEVTGANAIYKLRVFTGGALENDNLAYTNQGTSDVYDIDKPIYLRGNESCFLFEVTKGEADVKLKSLTLTPVSEANVQVEPSSAVASEYAVGAAATQISFNVGAMAPSAVTAVSSSDAVMTAAYSGNTVTLTPVAAGTADITVTATYNSKEYTKKYSVTVSGKASAEIGEAEAGSPFAEKYAYIEENANGTFNVTFIGGINKLEGYSAVGFEIIVNGVEGEAVYSQDDKVYTKLSVNGDEYEAQKDYDAGHIFVGSREEIAAGSTVVARPYVVIKNEQGEEEKKFLANATLTLQL